MTELQKAWLRRILLGGAIGVALDVGGFALLRGVLSAGFPSLFELIAAFSLGAAIGVGTLPFDEHGRALAVRSLVHYLVTGLLTVQLGWAAKGGGGFGVGAIFLLGVYTFFYLAVWLVRWLGWRSELDELRAALSLPAPPPSPFHWRESIPYALLLAGCFLLLRPLAEVLDASDVPLLRALILPWMAYPFAAVLTGWASGRGRGFCPLVPLAAFVAFLPNLWWKNLPYDWEMGLVYAALALGANLLGAAWRKYGGKGRGGGGMGSYRPTGDEGT